MATISDTNERNISTVRTTPYGIRSGSSSQMERQTSKVQKKASSTIREGLGTQAVGTEELSASAIDNLNAQMAEKDSMIVSLQSALAARDIRIAELDAAVDTLKGQVTDLSRIQSEQSAIIASQDMALNEVRYVYANSNQLREHNIISGGGLFSKTKVMEGDFDVNFFTTADQRTLTTIFLESKKAKILTKHPQESYELVKDAEGFYTLNITNPGSFWSLSRYLVVEIN